MKQETDGFRIDCEKEQEMLDAEEQKSAATLTDPEEKQECIIAEAKPKLKVVELDQLETTYSMHLLEKAVLPNISRNILRNNPEGYPQVDNKKPATDNKKLASVPQAKHVHA